MKIEDKYKIVVAELEEAEAKLEDLRADMQLILSEKAYFRVCNDINRRAKERGQ